MNVRMLLRESKLLAAHRFRSEGSRKFSIRGPARDHADVHPNLSTQQIEPPNERSLPHHEATRPESFLFKYTANNLIVPSTVRAMGVGSAGIKLYCDRPIIGNIHELVKTELRGYEKPSQAESALEMVRYAFESAFNSLKATAATEMVYLQLFGRPRTGTIRAAGITIPINPFERRWFLTCELSRQKTTVPTTSRPWLALRIYSLSPRKYCSLGSKLASKDAALEIAIRGHAKPAIYLDRASSVSAMPDVAAAHPMNEPLQYLVDQVVKNVVSGLGNRTFLSDKDLLDQTQSAVCDELQQSGLRSLMDFSHLMLELRGFNRERAVHNILLGSDGTPQSPTKNAVVLNSHRQFLEQTAQQETAAPLASKPSHTQPAAPIEVSAMHAALPPPQGAESRAIMEYDLEQLSSITRQLGISALRAFYIVQPLGPLPNADITAIVQKLERSATQLPHQGLALAVELAGHVKQTAEAASNGVILSLTAPLKVDVPGAHLLNSSSFDIEIYVEPSPTHLAAVAITLPVLQSMNVLVRDDVGVETFCTDVAVRLYYPPGRPQGLTESRGVEEHTADLTKSAFSVASKVLGGMIFNTFDSIAAYLSEAILRTTPNKLSGCHLLGVRTTVSRKGNSTTSSSGDAVRRPEPFLHQTGLSGEKPQRIRTAFRSPSGADRSVSTQEVQPTPRPWRRTMLRGAGDSARVALAVSEPVMESPALTSRTKLNTFGFRATWPRRAAPLASVINDQKIQTMFEREFNSRTSHGLAFLRDVSVGVSESIPSRHTLQLILRAKHLPVCADDAGGYPLREFLQIQIKTDTSKDFRKQTTITIQFPIMLDLPTMSGNINDFGFIRLKADGCVDPHQAHEFGTDLPGAVMEALRNVGKIVKPLFAESDISQDADSLARRCAQSLEATKTWVLPGLALSQLEVAIGHSRGLRYQKPKATMQWTIQASSSSQDGEDKPCYPIEEGLGEVDRAAVGPEKTAAISNAGSELIGSAIDTNGRPRLLVFRSQNLNEQFGLPQLEVVFRWMGRQTASASTLAKRICETLDVTCRTVQLSGFAGLMEITKTLSQKTTTQGATMRCSYWLPAVQMPNLSLEGLDRAAKLAITPTEENITISMPRMLQLEYRKRTGKSYFVNLAVTLTGLTLDSTESGTKAGFLSVLSSQLQMMRHIAAPILADENNDDDNAVAQRIAEALLSHATHLSPSISVDSISTSVYPGHVEVRGGKGSAGRQRSVFVALGSNIGDRFDVIETACRAIDSDNDMRIVRTSPLYETKPMYVEDQGRFLNGVCELDTTLQPLDLLDRLQAIEKELGRVKTVDKGPRNIDLDILTYGVLGRRVESERLTIPHPLMTEREFVLRPLAALNPFGLQPLNRSVVALLDRVHNPDLRSTMFPQTPLGMSSEVITAADPARPTRVMAIMNVTPDSFSDGGVNPTSDIEALKEIAAQQIAAGATMIDVGGQSSRPNAPDVTAEEEIARILPAIEAIKSLPEAANIPISTDTYRAAVAEAAIRAGAHIINDISAGTLDADMLPTIARLGCTYIMMHMRGTPATMQNEENTSYPDGLIPTIASELHARLAAAERAGIRRWRIILDPGIGFAKTQEQNLEVLRALPELVKDWGLDQYPWLVGSSRKGFIGKITGVQEPKERTWGTAATVTAAVQGGADIVRVHDVREMVQVVKTADAMYRVG